jgi:rubrerythrin
MKKYTCSASPADSIMTKPPATLITASAPGTKWEDVPEDWVCPVCGVGKDQFLEE